MAITDRRGVTVSSVDPPIAGDPNPGLAIKAPVVVATTGSNITLSGLQTVDGVALNAGDRVLVKDQTDATTNGIYNASTGTWTRAIDANSNDQFTQGLYVASALGTNNGGHQWQLTTANPVVLGTSTITWAEVLFPVSAIEWIVNGGGVTPAPGYQDDFEVPFACTITAVRLFADKVGSLVVDIWKAPFASFPPTISNSICAADLPTLSGAQDMQDTTLTGWTKALLAGDVLRFNLNSISTCTRFTLSLRVTRS